MAIRGNVLENFKINLRIRSPTGCSFHYTLISWVFFKKGNLHKAICNGHTRQCLGKLQNKFADQVLVKPNMSNPINFPDWV